MQLEGPSESEARDRIWLFDIHGLIERKDLNPYQQRYAHRLDGDRPHALPSYPHGSSARSPDFVEAIQRIKPTALIGVSTKAKAFTRDVIEAMARINERPIVFALSNPTEHAECTPEEAYRWSNGKAIYAAGVQFPPVVLARRVTDEMFIEAARATADQVTEDQRERGMLFPPQSNVIEIEVRTSASRSSYSIATSRRSSARRTSGPGCAACCASQSTRRCSHGARDAPHRHRRARHAHRERLDGPRSRYPPITTGARRRSARSYTFRSAMGIGPALRARGARPPRERAGVVDHAGQGQPDAV